LIFLPAARQVERKGGGNNLNYQRETLAGSGFFWIGEIDKL
jgi:hypothetical protein